MAATNTLLTIDQITNEALRIAHEKCTFLGTVNREFDDSFGREGAKIGSTLRIRKPIQYTRTAGAAVATIQNSVETNTTLVVATQDHVAMSFTSAEQFLKLDDFSKRHIEPAMAVLVSGIEGDCLRLATQGTYNVAGTAGTAMTDLLVPGIARAKLNQGLAPKDNNRSIQMDSMTMAGLVNGLKGLFQDSPQIKEQYREGMIGRTAMADYYENERLWTLTNDADVTGATDAAALVTDGGTTVDMHTLVAAPALGSVFTILGVYAIHPETKAAFPNLQDFTVTVVNGGVVTVSPQIVLTGPRRNVGKVDGSALATTDFNAKTVVFRGAASTAYLQSLMYHKDAYTFATGDLPLMAGSERCVRKSYDGISLRVWQDGDIRNDEMVTRIDILWGFAVIRPEWACRMIGAAAA